MATFDFKCWFYQLPLSDEVANSACFRLPSGWMQLLVGPMGHKNMVYVAHTITAFLARHATRSLPTVTADVITDNVAFFGTNLQDLLVACSEFTSVCALVSATIGESTPPAAGGTHRGMVFDLLSRTVSLKDTWLGEFRSRVAAAHERIPFQAWESLAGAVAWIFSVLVETPHPLPYFLFRFVARKSHRPKEAVLGWPSAVRELTALLASIDAAPAACLKQHTQTSTAFLITDACKSGPFSGWGAVVVADGRIFSTSATFPLGEAGHINELEMRAIALGLHYALSLHVDSPLHILCDNKAACQILKKGRSSSRPLHMLARHIRSLAHSSVVSLTVSWIPSAMNPADGLSRGAALSHRDVDLAHALVSMDWVGTEAPVDQRTPHRDRPGSLTLWPSISFPLKSAFG